MKECAEAYTKQTHIAVEVTAGPESKWFAMAQGDADVIYGGAEYMLLSPISNILDSCSRDRARNCILGK